MLIQHETGKLASQLYQRQPTLSSALEIETTQRCKEWPPRNRQYLQQLCHCLTRCIQWGKVFMNCISQKNTISHICIVFAFKFSADSDLNTAAELLLIFQSWKKVDQWRLKICIGLRIQISFYHNYEMNRLLLKFELIGMKTKELNLVISSSSVQNLKLE